MLRLSELIERIRPAGSPGAAAEGAEQHDRALREAEIADLAQLLAEFERESDRLVEDARQDAHRIRRDGERRVDQIFAGRADRVARARAAGIDPDRDDVERDTIAHTARREADRLRQDAAARLPEMATAIVASIWSVLPAEGRS